MLFGCRLLIPLPCRNINPNSLNIMKKRKVKVQACTAQNGNGRRKFLRMSGLAIAGSGLLIGCSDDDDFIAPPDPDPDPDPDPVFDLGSGNLGILNYAYALEQLEAAFYQKVLDGSYWMGLDNGEEKQILEDVRNHEVIHREFFKTAINAAVPAEQVLPDLEFDFSSVDFTNRSSVLNTAKMLEDTGVQAYNGAGKLIDTSQTNGAVYLLTAGKIVSVEARHASAIRDLLNPGSSDFAGDDVLTDLGGSGVAYDKATPPAYILAAVGNLNFITTEFTANNLPS